MESELRKRIQIYDLTAILLTIVLGGLCCRLSVNPTDSESPSDLLNSFLSYEELKNFLQKNSDTPGYHPYLESWRRSSVNVPGFYALSATSETQLSELDYSPTNVQVEGVDESDIVKTDGESLYLISGNNVSILEAYPPEEVEVLSRITFDHTYLQGLFVEGDRLVILGLEYGDSSHRYSSELYLNGETFLNVYDISNRTTPQLLRSFTMTGSYFSSRLIGEHVYCVVSRQASLLNDTVMLPQLRSEEGNKTVEATDVQYFNTSDNYFVFTTILAVNVQNVEEGPTNKTLLLGGASCMYVSLDNLYITFPKGENTSIYRIHIANGKIEPSAEGEVPGYVIN